MSTSTGPSSSSGSQAGGPGPDGAGGSGGIAGLDLGPGPRPDDAEQWERRLRDGVYDMLGEAGPEVARLWAQTQIEIEPGTGADLRNVRIDATGLRATQTGLEGVGGLTRPTFPESAEAEPITLHRVELLAEPAYLDGVPVEAEALLEDLQGRMVRDSGRHLWLLTDPQRSTAELRGRGSVAIRTEDLQELARAAVSQQLQDMGLTLSSLRVRLRADHPRALAVLAEAKVRRGLLSATVQVRMDAHVDDQMVAHVGQVQARSGNPLVSMVLAAVRGKLDRYAGRTFDLNALMPAGLHLVDLSVQTGDRLVISARIA